MTHKPDVPLGDVRQFLVSRHARPFQELAPLPGGFWSAAYAYRVGRQDLVPRLATIPEASRPIGQPWRSAAPDLPVPDGCRDRSGLRRRQCHSERHFGRFVEDRQNPQPLCQFHLARWASGDLAVGTVVARCQLARLWPEPVRLHHWMVQRQVPQERLRVSVFVRSLVGSGAVGRDGTTL